MLIFFLHQLKYLKMSKIFSKHLINGIFQTPQTITELSLHPLFSKLIQQYNVNKCPAIIFLRDPQCCTIN